jgi:predicted AlkP superfamily phosphohydrolase/phosphomutase
MALDELIGRLVAEAGPAALTMVVSDHGMGPCATRRFYINDWLLQEGFLSLRRRAWTNPNAWLRRLGISRDAAARLLSLLPSRLVGALRSKVGRIDIPVDYSRSRAYLQPIYEFVAGIRLVDGCLPDESEGLLRELTDSLLSVIDPETGDRIVDKVYRREEVYHGPYISESPHLIAILNPGFVASHRVGNKALVSGRREISSAAMVTGAHRFEGIFIAHGPGIKKRSRPHFSFRLQDISPSVLYLAGLPVPDHMDGRVLQEVIDADLLEQRPVQYVSTDLPGPVGGGPGLTAREEAEVRRQLKGLGYLG